MLCQVSDDYQFRMDDRDTFVPHHTREALLAYVQEGRRTGDFLYFLLSNNLSAAIGHADDINQRHIVSIYKWVWNFAPSPCHGTEDKVQAWLKKGQDAVEVRPKLIKS